MLFLSLSVFLFINCYEKKKLEICLFYLISEPESLENKKRIFLKSYSPKACVALTYKNDHVCLETWKQEDT